MSEYVNIQPPFATLKFREMSKRDLRNYYDWFLKQIPERIEILTMAVNSSSHGFQLWQPTYAPESLSTLGSWFSSQIQTRNKTLEELKSSLISYDKVETQNWIFTNHTLSIAMDVGMYLSQVFLRNHPQLKWDQLFGNKRFIDYGQPRTGWFRRRCSF